LETHRLLAEDSKYFMHQSLSTPCLNVLSDCGGSRIKDIQGRSYLDFHGNSVHQVGFSHPRVIAAITDQLQSLSFCTRRYTNVVAIELAKKLVEVTPGSLSKVLLAPGGTTAVGMALKLARMATGRFKTISMWDAFHGASLDAISVSGEALFRRNIGPLLPGTEHVPPADPYRCLWDPGGHCDRCNLKCARYIEYVLEKEGDIAAVIAEPIRSTAVNPPPPDYWRAVRVACDRWGALLILDETAVCLGRTGRMFASQVYNVIPDILILGKGLGGGVFPLAAIVARKELNYAPESALGHYTHEKNPVACAAALATITLIEEEKLAERADRLGAIALKRLQGLVSSIPFIGDVRGQGLLFGIELVRDLHTKEPAVEEANQVMYRCLELGLSFKVSRGNFLTLAPPLNIKQQDLDEALGILETALAELQ
jgi:4-aminobutyrate aminotransferase